MNGVQQGWLVAVREMRERSRSRAFRASVMVMILVVVGLIVVPSLLESDAGTRDVGLAGSTPTELRDVIEDRSDAIDITVSVHRYESVAAGEDAVRQGDADVLLIDGQRLEWHRQTDEQLRAVLTGAVQLLAIRERAVAAGIDPDDLVRLVAPVALTDITLGSVEGRSPDDETAAMVMTVVLFIAISTYGSLVLTGVVEEKSSRVVEVLLARLPARRLLAGKVAGIGMLGLGQVAVMALVALAAIAMVDAVDIPAVSATVLVWVVAWFVLGYAFYAVVYGALGALASRIEDAQSVAGPVTAVLIAGYFASFVAVGRPDSGLAKLASFFPATAPLAMPNRIAMAATAWWEPFLAAGLTIAAIAGLVRFGGRVYSGAVLHTGATLELRDAWRGTIKPRTDPHPSGSKVPALVKPAPFRRHPPARR